MKKEQRVLHIGVLGCGPIAQCAHLDAVRKAKNADLYAICDAARDLLARMHCIHQPVRAYADYAAMLSDRLVEAVRIAVDDRYHAELASKALRAGQQVLIEKPLAVTVEECAQLQQEVYSSKLTLQVGNNRRFHPGWQDAQRFLREEMGAVLSLSAWYHDSIYRYSFQENLYLIPVIGEQVRRPQEEWKGVRQRYFLLTHGSHLLDTARFFLGEIAAVQASHTQAETVHCWTIDATFTAGCHGQLRLLVPAHADFEEGFQIYGEQGTIEGKALLPWFQRASVTCFKDGRYSRVLGEDGYTFKRQVEAFAETILHGAPQRGATVEDGAATVRALVAISRSVATGRRVRLSEVGGPVLTDEEVNLLTCTPQAASQKVPLTTGAFSAYRIERKPVQEIPLSPLPLGIFAKTFVRSGLVPNADAIGQSGFRIVQYNLTCAGLPSLPEHIEPAMTSQIRQALRERGITIAAVSRTFNMIHPNREVRETGFRGLRELALNARALGTTLVTLCTGTHDKEDMWRGHPDNASPEAWKDLLNSMERALAIAEEADITLAIEPEIANVVDSASKARQLLDQFWSPRLKIIIDPANLFHAQDQARQHTVLDEAFDLLAKDIVLAHAKDVAFQGKTVVHCAAGQGVLDYAPYLTHLRALHVPLILHGLQESEVASSLAFLRSQLERSEKQPVAVLGG